jgi:hypothetical protein
MRVEELERSHTMVTTISVESIGQIACAVGLSTDDEGGQS